MHKPVEEVVDVMHFMHDKIDHVLHFLGLEASSDEDASRSWLGRLICGRSERKEPAARPSLFRAVMPGSETASPSSAARPHGEQPAIASSSREAGDASEPRQLHMPGIRRQTFKKERLPKTMTS